MNPESPWPPVFSLFCEFHHFLKVSVYHPNGSTPVAKWWVTTSQGDMGFPTSPTSEPALPHVLLGLATGSTRNRRTYNHGVCRDISMSDLCINKYIYIYICWYILCTYYIVYTTYTHIYIYICASNPKFVLYFGGFKPQKKSRNQSKKAGGFKALVVSPLLNNMLVKLDHFPRWGWKFQKCLSCHHLEYYITYYIYLAKL